MTHGLTTTTTTHQRAKALANCAQDWHRWHPTFSLGEKVCIVCGLYAYCPQCQYRRPSEARLLLCALHRRDEEKREGER